MLQTAGIRQPSRKASKLYVMIVLPGLALLQLVAIASL
jgi:hypothetical protein